MKFEILALLCLHFHIYLNRAYGRIMRPYPLLPKLRVILTISLDRAMHFSSGFSRFPDAIWCYLTCFSIFPIEKSSLLDNHDFLLYIIAIFRAEISRFSTIILHDLAERGDRSLLIVGKKVEVSLRLFDIFQRNMVFIFSCQSWASRSSECGLRWNW